MASPTGGRFIIGPQAPAVFVNMGINDGIDPVTTNPSTVIGAFNVEVFTATGLTTVPTPDAGWNAAILDPGGTTVPFGSGSFLSGSNVTLGGGNYLFTDTGGAPASITLGTGNQQAVGAAGDTIIGGSGADSITGGAGGSVVGGSGSAAIDGTAGKMTIAVGSGPDTIVGTSTKTVAGSDVITGGSGAVLIQSLGKGDVVNFANQTGNATINANTAANTTNVGGVSVTLGAGGGTVYGGQGDTINLGSVGQYADGGAGKMTVTDGSAGTDSVFGSSVAGGGDTFAGGSGNLDFNAQAGGGDLINLAGSSGSATINAYLNGTTQLTAVNDTIMAGNGSDSVWGGPGDRIGVGNSSAAGGTHLFDHSTSIAGAAMAFGTNDSVGGSSTAKVTVTHFAQGTDSLFYQNENSTTTNNIVTSQVNSAGNTTITLPDGTQMILIGVASINAGFFKP
jgi:hypothetical protein